MRINQNDLKFLEKFRFWENAHYKDRRNSKDFLLAQVFFCKKKKCIDVRVMFNGEEAKRKGFYYVRL